MAVSKKKRKVKSHAQLIGESYDILSKQPQTLSKLSKKIGASAETTKKILEEWELIADIILETGDVPYLVSSPPTTMILLQKKFETKNGSDGIYFTKKPREIATLRVKKKIEEPYY